VRCANFTGLERILSECALCNAEISRTLQSNIESGSKPPPFDKVYGPLGTLQERKQFGMMKKMEKLNDQGFAGTH
jgi:hypothetical protein